MQPPALDDHQAEYWARQIRIGALIAAVVTLCGAVRILADWAPSHQWAAAPILFAAVCQALAALLPWESLVLRPGVRRWLVTWWVAELPLLFVFAVYDRDGVMSYLPGVTLVLVTSAALYSPAVVVGLGAVSVGGYLVLLPDAIGDTPVANLALTAIMASVVGVTAINAQSRRRLDARRRAAERRTELLLEASTDAVLALGVDRRIRYASPSVLAMLGIGADQLSGSGLGRLVHPDDLPGVRAWMGRLWDAAPGRTARTDARMIRADGTWLYLDMIGTNRVEDPDLRAVVISLRDIGTRRALEEELSRQAFTDSLTGMPNRALFRDRLEHAVGRGGPVTVLLIDVDNFKLVNDNLGHSAGDELLTTMAERLRGHIRPGDTLARLGGDEFAVLVADLDASDAAVLAERLLAEARRPTRLGSRDVTATLSIGIASSVGGDVSAEQLLRNADLAMYAAKHGGRDAWAAFEPAMHRSVIEEAQQREDMERALAEQQFVVHYQPVVDMASQRLIGAEALVRWMHPRDGLLGPQEFIGNAEESGLIVPLGRWVLRAACAQLAEWQRVTPFATELKMNVNLSARQFQYDGLVGDVTAAISDAGIAPRCLTLEITESMLMQDVDAAIVTLQSLRRLGVQVAIDDFGTGYSSLSYLKRLPVDIIKIDRSFVAQVDTDSGDVALVDAVVGLGQALHLQTVAEGIETDGQWQMLRRIGCDHGQGYLFGRPAEPGEVTRLLAGLPPAAAVLR